MRNDGGGPQVTDLCYSPLVRLGKPIEGNRIVDCAKLVVTLLFQVVSSFLMLLPYVDGELASFGQLWSHDQGKPRNLSRFNREGIQFGLAKRAWEDFRLHFTKI